MTRTARLVVVLAALADVAHADEPIVRETGFDVEREASPPGRAEFSFDAGGTLGAVEPGTSHAGRWALAAQLIYLHQPYTLATSTVEVVPVRHRQTLAIGGAFAISSSIVVDARLPLSHQTGDRLQGLYIDDRSLDPWVIGDLGLGARLRLTQREHYAAFVRGHLTLGTGDDYELAGEVNFTAAWMMIARAMPTDDFVVAATAGVRFRGAEVVVADRLLGDELFGALGASYALPEIPGLYCDANDVRITAELTGSLGNDVGNKRGPSPVEAKLGLVSRIRPWWNVAARVSTGLNDQIGAARLRAMLELVYVGEL